MDDRMHEMHTIQVQQEKETLEKIKQKVERIKTNQRRFEPDLTAAKTHQEAVRYKGKYLYEDSIKPTDVNVRQNDSAFESEESFLLRHHSRFESSMREPNSFIRNESRLQANESRLQNEDGIQSKNSAIFYGLTNSSHSILFSNRELLQLNLARLINFDYFVSVQVFT